MNWLEYQTQRINEQLIPELDQLLADIRDDLKDIETYVKSEDFDLLVEEMESG